MTWSLIALAWLCSWSNIYFLTKQAHRVVKATSSVQIDTPVSCAWMSKAKCFAMFLSNVFGNIPVICVLEYSDHEF